MTIPELVAELVETIVADLETGSSTVADAWNYLDEFEKAEFRSEWERGLTEVIDAAGMLHPVD